MNVLVIGSTGRVGEELINTLLDQKHQVYAGSRREKLKHDRTEVLTHIQIDLTAPLKEIEKTIPEKLDAIYFVAGSRGKNLLQVDLHGAVKTMQAAKNKGIKRYILLSTIFALDKSKWEHIPDDMIDYYIAKYFADHYLVHNSGLDYTILQPGYLEEKEGDGKITVDVNDAGKNSIKNVAATLAAALEQDNSVGKVITMHDGETPIEEALASL